MILSLLLALAPVVQPVSSSTLRDGGTSFVVRAQGNVLSQPADYNATLFGHARVAAPYTLADVIHTYGLDTEIWGVLDAGGATTNLVDEAAVFLSPPSDGGTHVIMTHDRYRYQAGKAQLVLQTGMFPSAADAGVTRLGYFDEDDGLFWQRDSRGLGFVRRTSTDGGVPVDHWTAVDAGPSYAPQNGNIYEMRMAWLGVHEVDGYLNGEKVFRENFDGRLAAVYMKTAFLPLRAEVSGGARMKHVCSSVQSEGGSAPTSYGFVAPSLEKPVPAASGFLPIMSIRPAALINGLPNHAQIIPTTINCASDGKRIRVRLRLNAVLTGASWALADAKAGVEVDTSATSFTNGSQVCGFAVGDNSATENELGHVFGELKRKLRTRAFGAADTLTVVASAVSGTSTVSCSIEWQEVR
jgi:hypothetical protein